jgi:uncharacterized protein
MRILTALVACLLAFGIAPAHAQAQAQDGRYGQQKVAYHINLDGGPENAYYLASMRNVQNHINAVGASNIEVRIVMHGNGINLVKNAKDNTRLQSAIAALKGQKVEFVVCKNTLTDRKIEREALYDVDAEDIVPSGVAELSYLQMKGFTYIKP